MKKTIYKEGKYWSQKQYAEHRGISPVTVCAQIAKKAQLPGIKNVIQFDGKNILEIDTETIANFKDSKRIYG